MNDFSRCVAVAGCLAAATLSGGQHTMAQGFTADSTYSMELKALDGRLRVAVFDPNHKCRTAADDALISETTEFLDKTRADVYALQNVLSETAYQNLIEDRRDASRHRNGLRRLPPCPVPAAVAPAPPPLLLPQHTSFEPLGSTLNAGFEFGVSAPRVSNSWTPNPTGFGIDTHFLEVFSRRVLEEHAATVGGSVGMDFQLGSDLIAGRYLLNRGGLGIGQDPGPDRTDIKALSNAVLIGWVADLHAGGASVNRTEAFPSVTGGHFPIQQNAIIGFDATQRLRGGVSFPISTGMWITPFVTGGIAEARIKVSNSMLFLTSFNFGQSSQVKLGSALGAGIMISNGGIRFTTQFIHEDFGSTSTFAPNTMFPASFITTHQRVTNNRVTVGVEATVDLQNLSSRFPVM